MMTVAFEAFTEQDWTDLYQFLRELRVGLSHDWGFNVDGHCVAEIARDRESFLARMYGITRETFVGWERRNEDHFQCLAKTTRGTRCGNRVLATAFDPNQFDPRNPEFDYCRVHVGQPAPVGPPVIWRG